jgi:FkbM family methyltransferase
MKTILIYLEKYFLGKKRFQPFFESIHRFSLRGMNLNQAMHVNKSGEIPAMKFIHDNFNFNNDKFYILDIGGNKGDWSLEAKKYFTNCNFVVFEPSAKYYNSLLELFSNHKNTKIECQGLSNFSGKINLYNSGSDIGSVYPNDNSTDSVDEIVVTTLDQYSQENDIKNILLLKIDVEGAELDILNGSINLIADNAIKFIQFEFGANNIECRVFLKDFFEILSEYKIYRILKDGLKEMEYDRRFEIQQPCNYLAVHKTVYY